MSEEKKINDQQESGSPEQLSLNDDRRVKVLSPGTLVAKRFFRNRLAVVGLDDPRRDVHFLLHRRPGISPYEAGRGLLPRRYPAQGTTPP